MSDTQICDVDAPDLLEKIRFLIKEEKWEDALSCLEGYLAEMKNEAESEGYSDNVTEGLSLLGVVLYKLGNLADSVSFFRKVQDRPTASSDVPEVLAVLYALAGRLIDALFYGKLSTVREWDNRIFDLLGPHFPKFSDVFLNIQEKPLIKRAKNKLADGEDAAALGFFEQQLYFDERDEEALWGKAETLMKLEKADLAVQVLRYLRQIAPENIQILSRLGSALTAAGYFMEGLACHKLAVTMDPEDVEVAAAWVKDSEIFPLESSFVQEEAFRALANSMGELDESDKHFSWNENAKIRLGLLIVDLPPNQMRVVGGVLRCLDTKIPIVLYGRGELTDPKNKFYQGIKATWRNVDRVDGYTFAEIVKGDEVSVLINVSGWLAPSFLVAHTQYPASVQISWMNNPQRNLFPGVDWRLDGAKAEGSWVLPYGVYAVDEAEISSSLPEVKSVVHTGFSFGVDTTPEYISPDMALHWARILQEMPASSLVVRERALGGGAEAAQRLIDLFGDFGVAHRVEIAHDADLETFISSIDLLLIPFRDQPFEEVTLALKQGIPVVALDPEERSLGPFLKALGLEESMLAHNGEEYCQKALMLSEKEKYRSQFEAISQNETWKTSPVFSFNELASEIEKALGEMLSKASSLRK